MQDRFKYMAWYKPKKKMYNVICLNCFQQKDIIISGINNNKYFGMVDWNECDIIQCTGLKDKNGKLIYEGNIVRSDEYPFNSDGQDNYLAEICWDDESASFSYYIYKNPKFNDVRGISVGTTGFINEYKFEIIGNKFQNPELLESEE